MLLRSLAVASIALSGLALIPTEASARWVCRASSPTGSWGVGWHTRSRSYAVRRALAECAIRTPSYSRCYLRRCSWRGYRPYY